MTAYLVDEALDMRLTVDELAAVKEAKRPPLPDGQRWATEADYDDPLPTAPVVAGPAAGVAR